MSSKGSVVHTVFPECVLPGLRNSQGGSGFRWAPGVETAGSRHVLLPAELTGRSARWWLVNLALSQFWASAPLWLDSDGRHLQVILNYIPRRPSGQASAKGLWFLFCSKGTILPLSGRVTSFRIDELLSCRRMTLRVV